MDEHSDATVTVNIPRVFRIRPTVIVAVQWFRNGDHPADGDARFSEGEFAGEKFEGKVVRYFRRPDISGTDSCIHCGRTFHDHGWINGTLQGGNLVCPGDWILVEPNGNGYYPCKPDAFAARYEEVTDAPSVEPLSLIAAERERQRGEWSLAHDDTHTLGEMAMAAACYAAPKNLHVYSHKGFSSAWPWESGKGCNPNAAGGDRIRSLVIAGALIVAEIERMQRASA